MAYFKPINTKQINIKEYSTVQERDAFDERIFEIVQEYIEDGNSESDFGLSINPQTLELALVSPENNPEGWDFRPINGLFAPIKTTPVMNLIAMLLMEE